MQGDGGKKAAKKSTEQPTQCLHKHKTTKQHVRAVSNKETADRAKDPDPATAAAPGGQANLDKAFRASPTQSDGMRKRLRVALWLTEGIAIAKFPSLMELCVSIGALTPTRVRMMGTSARPGLGTGPCSRLGA